MLPLKGGAVKDLGLISYITQLGLSVGAPIAGFTLIGVWLRNRYNLGSWFVALFCVIGLISGVHGFITELKAIQKRLNKKDKDVPRSYNTHE